MSRWKWSAWTGYLNGYIGPLATSGGLVNFMREQLGKPIPSPVVLGQVTEKFREGVKAMAEQQAIPIYQFNHKGGKTTSPTGSGSSAVCAMASCSSVWRMRKRKPSQARKSMGSSSSRATRACTSTTTFLH